jgi:hypothetical protein
MEKLKITFWKMPYNAEDSFLKDINSFLASAEISKFSKGSNDIFRVKLSDIGLDSLYGEFDIIRKNGFWQTSDTDSAEFNFLKWNIIGELDHLDI